ncbi:MAG: hotdog fold thioesterase [Gemmatimonas sp.]
MNATSGGTSDAHEVAERVVDAMLLVDSFSRGLGIENIEIAPGRSVIRMTVRDDMMNGMGGVHGGALYSLADSAFSYATNNSGIISVAIDCAMSYPAAARVGDVLTAVAVVESGSRRLQFCSVTVRNQNDVIVGHFRGTVYRTHKAHFPEAESSADASIKKNSEPT